MGIARAWVAWAAAAFLVGLLLLCVVPCPAQDTQWPFVAPPNPEFVDYLLSATVVGTLDHVEDGYPLGLIPVPVDLSHTRGSRILKEQVGDPIPASFDLRTLSPARLTPVRNQGSCGSCWAFATYGSLESCLLPGQVLDFSENHLKNRHGLDWTCCNGGNHFISTAYLARRIGPVLETSDPYNAGSCASAAGLPVERYVQQVDFIPDRSGPLDNEAIKQAVMTQGAIYTSMYWSSSCYNAANRAYYYGSGSASSNHAVCIVGWDDNYDKSRFPTTPPGNGAFIIRNSWGSGWGEGGYFYISYYDSNTGKSNAVFGSAGPVAAWDRIYQYDPLGWVSSLGFGSQTGWFANVFTAASAGSLVAASFYTASPSSTYEMRVYLNPNNGPVRASGPVLTTSGTIPGYGYRTIALPSPVQLSAGQKFSVVVKLTTPGYTYPIPFEYPYSGYSSAATSNAGESYVSSNGSSWSDIRSYYANANVCLKAFTHEGGGLIVTPSTDSASVGPVGGPFSPASHVYTISNSGTTALQWSASAGGSWVSLSATAGALNPGKSTSITATINEAAGALPAGSHCDTISFTNLTEGTGSTSRRVDLSVYTSYSIRSVTHGWIDPSGHTAISLADDGVSSARSIPFEFVFYGKTYNQVYVGANGVVGFAETGMGAYSNSDLPSVGAPNAVLCPYWDDLNPSSSGSVRIGAVGEAPNRQLVVSWVGVPVYSASSTKLTFQAMLCEGTNDVIFQYQDVKPSDSTYGAGRSATVGIENETGTAAARYSYNGSTLLSNGLALLFSSRAPDVFDLKAQPNASSAAIDRAIVTAVFGDLFYIESDDRSAGLAVRRVGHGAAVGMRVNVSGTLKTNSDGERVLEASSVVQNGMGSVSPLGLTNRALGGADSRYDALTGAGQAGITDGSGANNIGLLVCTTGRVVRIDTDGFHIDDGSGLSDGSGAAGVRIYAPGLAAPAVGAYVKVIGISSCHTTASGVHPMLRVGNQPGIVVL